MNNTGYGITLHRYGTNHWDVWYNNRFVAYFLSREAAEKYVAKQIKP